MTHLESFSHLKKALSTAPVIIAPDLSLPFELMCDVSDFAIRAVLGQRRGKIIHVIYYVRRTFDNAQMNYATIEKNLLAVVFTFDKFCLSSWNKSGGVD